MKRGEIFFTIIEDCANAKNRQRRPIVIVSNNANNRLSSTVTIVPLTANINKVHPFEVLITTKKSGLAKDAKACCQQTQTVAKHQLEPKQVGMVDSGLMLQMDQALKLHLGL